MARTFTTTCGPVRLTGLSTTANLFDLLGTKPLVGRTFDAKVTRLAWSLDASNRSLRTEIDVSNPEVYAGYVKANAEPFARFGAKLSPA